MFRQAGAVTAIVLATALPLAGQVPSGAVSFDDESDTIVMAGHTVLGTSTTFEARIYLPTGVGAFGTVFNEWTNFAEDKLLFAGPTGLRGYVAPVVGLLLVASVDLDADEWHHIAFVQDAGAGEQRLYLDGVKVASRAGSGEIGDGGGDGFGHPFLGAIFRDGILNESFLGYLDTFRISDNARYTGDSFTAPTGDLTDDANTVALFNFAPADFVFDDNKTTVADLSGNGHTGTLGTGFPDATLPRIAATIDVDADSAVLALSDGLLILRQFFGFTGASLTTGAVGLDCERCDPDAVHPYISVLKADLDIDNDGAVTPLTDGLLLLRYLFGFTGTSLVQGALGLDCERCEPADIVTYIQGLD